jgi:hypothetical protein
VSATIRIDFGGVVIRATCRDLAWTPEPACDQSETARAALRALLDDFLPPEPSPSDPNPDHSAALRAVNYLNGIRPGMAEIAEYDEIEHEHEVGREY